MWGQIASRLIGVSVHSVYKCQVTVLYIKYCQLYFDFFFKSQEFHDSSNRALSQAQGPSKCRMLSNCTGCLLTRPALLNLFLYPER